MHRRNVTVNVFLAKKLLIGRDTGWKSFYFYDIVQLKWFLCIITYSFRSFLLLVNWWCTFPDTRKPQNFIFIYYLGKTCSLYSNLSTSFLKNRLIVCFNTVKTVNLDCHWMIQEFYKLLFYFSYVVTVPTIGF